MSVSIVVRRYTWQLYPTSVQLAALDEQRMMMADLWNALLQRYEDIQRRTVQRQTWVDGDGKRHSGVSLHCPTWTTERKKTGECAVIGPRDNGTPKPFTDFDMQNEVTWLANSCPEWRALSIWSGHGTAQRLHLAIQAFFRRMKELADPVVYAQRAAEFQRRKGRLPTRYELAGYPRYKRRAEYDSIPHRFASGCKLLPKVCERPGDAEDAGVARNRRQKEWRLTLKGVAGAIRARGELPGAALKWTDATMIFRDGKWWLSACVQVVPRIRPGADALSVRLDLIDEFARVERADGRRTAAGEGSLDSIPGSPCHLNTIDTALATSILLARMCGVGVVERHARSLRASNVDSAGQDVRGAVDLEVAGGQVTSKVDSAGQDVRAVAFRGHAIEGHPSNVDSVGASLARAALLTVQADDIKAERDTRWKKRSRRWRRATERAEKKMAKAARIRREALHVWSTEIVRSASDLTVTTPSVRRETTSPRGNEKQWGAAVEMVSKLNRNTLNQAPAMATAMLAYKAQEAGIRCDVVTDDAPKIAIGEKLVAAGRALRKAKRAIQEIGKC